MTTFLIGVLVGGPVWWAIETVRLELHVHRPFRGPLGDARPAGRPVPLHAPRRVRAGVVNRPASPLALIPLAAAVLLLAAHLTAWSIR